MESLVLNEMGAVAIGLSTVTAFIGLFPCVDSEMDYELRGLPEGLATLIALIGFLPSVDSLMPNEVRTPIKSFATFITSIEFLSLQNSLMFCRTGGQVWMSPKFLIFITPIFCGFIFIFLCYFQEIAFQSGPFFT